MKQCKTHAYKLLPIFFLFFTHNTYSMKKTIEEDTFEKRLIEAGKALEKFSVGAANRIVFGKLMESPEFFFGEKYGAYIKESKFNIPLALDFARNGGNFYKEGRNHLYNATKNKVTNYLFKAPAPRPEPQNKIVKATRSGCFGVFSLALGMLNSWLGVYFFKNPEKFVNLPTAEFLKTSGLRYAISGYQTGEAGNLASSAVDHFYNATSNIIDACRECCGKREKEKEG